MVEIRPYGAWASPVTAASLAEGAIGIAELRVTDGRLYWLETRPAEGGRLVAMTRDLDGSARLAAPRRSRAFTDCPDASVMPPRYPTSSMARNFSSRLPNPIPNPGASYAWAS